MRVEISNRSLVIDGVDIARAVTTVAVYLIPTERPRVELTLLADDLVMDLDPAVVDVVDRITSLGGADG